MIGSCQWEIWDLAMYARNPVGITRRFIEGITHVFSLPPLPIS